MPNYVVKMSVWKVLKFWKLILIAGLIVAGLVLPTALNLTGTAATLAMVLPIAIGSLWFLKLICKIISNACISIEFYDDKIVQKRGVFARYERQMAFFGVKTVSIYKTFRARIFGYGDIIMDNFGGDDLDVDTVGIRRPEKLKQYLESVMEDDLNKVSHVFGS